MLTIRVSTGLDSGTVGDVRVSQQISASSFRLASETTPLPSAANYADLLARLQAVEARVQAAEARVRSAEALAAALLRY